VNNAALICGLLKKMNSSPDNSGRYQYDGKENIIDTETQVTLIVSDMNQARYLLHMLNSTQSVEIISEKDRNEFIQAITNTLYCKVESRLEQYERDGTTKGYRYFLTASRNYAVISLMYHGSIYNDEISRITVNGATQWISRVNKEKRERYKNILDWYLTEIRNNSLNQVNGESLALFPSTLNDQGLTISTIDGILTKTKRDMIRDGYDPEIKRLQCDHISGT